MTNRWTKAVALVGLGALCLATWQITIARGARQKKVVLPRPAQAAIARAFPQAAVQKVDFKPRVVAFYEVKLVHEGKEMEVEVFLNGEIFTVERRLTEGELPPPVAKALAAAAKGARVGEVTQKETRATISIQQFPKPETVYEAELTNGGKKLKVGIDPNGRVVSMKAAKDDDDDDDENEQDISLDKVPAAVRATILKEAGGNPVREVEVQDLRGKKYYEAEWTAGGKNVEIKVSEDGKLLRKRIGEDDDEDDDD